MNLKQLSGLNVNREKHKLNTLPIADRVSIYYTNSVRYVAVNKKKVFKMDVLRLVGAR